MHASTFANGRQSGVVTIAVDLAKNVFELAFADAGHRVVQRKRVSRLGFTKILAEHPPVRLIMEACGSAHYWGRVAQAHGHQVRLLPPRDVKPYVRRNKTDRTDVAGMLEADRCADIHPVPVKTELQQGMRALIGIREHLKGERTATINLVRGVLREFGIVIALGAGKVDAAARDALEDAENGIPMVLRSHLLSQLQRIRDLAAQMRAIERDLEACAASEASVQQMRTADGIGLLTATALHAHAGDLGRFKRAKQFSAWLGLVPKEHSSGERRHLGKLSRRGDISLRTLLIHGGRSFLQAARMHHARGQPLSRLQAWALALQARVGHNKAACAVANKLARRLWAMHHYGVAFDANHISHKSQAA